MAKKPTKKGNKAAKKIGKGNQPTTAKSSPKQAAPALDPATMPDDELETGLLALMDEFKKRGYAAEDAKKERIAALRAELAELGAPVDEAKPDEPDDEETTEPEADPMPNLKWLDGIFLRSQDKHFIGAALVVTASFVESGIIPLEHPTWELDPIGDMCSAAITISRAMYAAARSNGDMVWAMNALTAPDAAKAGED